MHYKLPKAATKLSMSAMSNPWLAVRIRPSRRFRAAQFRFST